MTIITKVNESNIALFKNIYKKRTNQPLYQEEANNPDLHCYVIHDETTSFGWVSVVGVPKIGKANKVYYVDEFYVDEWHRNKGYGFRLLQFVTSEFYKDSLRLYVDVKNESAIKLYQKFGFKKEANEVNYMIRSNSK